MINVLKLYVILSSNRARGAHKKFYKNLRKKVGFYVIHKKPMKHLSSRKEDITGMPATEKGLVRNLWFLAITHMDVPNTVLKHLCTQSDLGKLSAARKAFSLNHCDNFFLLVENGILYRWP